VKVISCLTFNNLLCSIATTSLRILLPRCTKCYSTLWILWFSFRWSSSFMGGCRVKV